jgi:hypothetical protein
MRAWKLSLFSALLAASAWARHPVVSTNPEAPWMTGPLIAPSGHITPGGHVNFEPYLWVTTEKGDYDQNWKLVKEPTVVNRSLQAFLTVGLTSWWDCGVSPTIAVNQCKNVKTFVFDDILAYTDFQILTDTLDNYLPAIKITIKEEFPNGKYDSLDPNNLETDVAGSGSYVTGVIITASRLFHLRGEKWMNARWAWIYNFPSRVHVKGLSVYGGAPDTDGYVYPPQNYQLIFSFEITLSRNWCLACDNIASFAKARRFKGHAGTLGAGEDAILTKGSAANFSIAPALEYNFDANMGLIAGVWCSYAGRNSGEFFGGSIAFNYYY